jgi:hypothetical protein
LGLMAVSPGRFTIVNQVETVNVGGICGRVEWKKLELLMTDLDEDRHYYEISNLTLLPSFWWCMKHPDGEGCTGIGEHFSSVAFRSVRDCRLMCHVGGGRWFFVFQLGHSRRS